MDFSISPSVFQVTLQINKSLKNRVKTQPQINSAAKFTFRQVSNFWQVTSKYINLFTFLMEIDNSIQSKTQTREKHTHTQMPGLIVLIVHKHYLVLLSSFLLLISTFLHHCLKWRRAVSDTQFKKEMRKKYKVKEILKNFAK